MPNAPKRPCKQCQRKHAINDTPYCEDHQRHAEKQHDKRRGSSASRGYDSKWRKLRAVKLSINPLCECDECKKSGVLKRATMVHHVKNVMDYPHLRLSLSNLESMDNDCHERVEKERGKRWNTK